MGQCAEGSATKASESLCDEDPEEVRDSGAAHGMSRVSVRYPPYHLARVLKIKTMSFDNSHSFFAHRSAMPRVALLICICLPGASGLAQVIPYIGTMGGVATLSAAAGSQLSAQGLSASSYSPDNGGALNLFAGVHLHDYFSVQGNYIWNQNDFVLSSTSSGSGIFYQEKRTSSQHAVVGDFLIYFRRRGSRIRPYLGTGFGMIHLSSTEERLVASGGNPILPPASFTSNRPILRSHVGIDLRLIDKLDFRYSFSEMIGKNDISSYLSPPASRRLENFQNLFGFVYRF